MATAAPRVVFIERRVLVIELIYIATTLTDANAALVKLCTINYLLV